MTKEQFVKCRKKLGKTQKQLADLLGTSLKTVHSYEQGWRKIPGHAERQLLFLVSMAAGTNRELGECWEVKDCPPERRSTCPAWEFKAGRMCWFINGTICEGEIHNSWNEKMKICRSCEVLIDLIDHD